MKISKIISLSLMLVTFLASSNVSAERIKDISSFAGVRSNQLLGYGLVVGLDGTGDQTSQTPFTIQSLKSFLKQYGVTIPPDINPQLKNVAAVTVHAELSPFAKPGQNIDITVSSLGNAKSLRGGSLLLTPLRGIDGQVYAIAQGNLVVGGLGVQGSDGSSISINIPSAGRIPNGASVERAVPSPFATSDELYLNLHAADFTTAKRVQMRINKHFKQNVAYAVDAVTIKVDAPLDTVSRVSFAADLENIELIPGEAAAKVIVNSRTGTVVIGSNVSVSPAAVTHGSLAVTITSDPLVSQPNEFSDGETVVVDRTNIEIEQEANRMFVFGPSVTLNEIVHAVNQVGAAPGDLVAILEALKQAGALRAELVII
ncbi:MAG: flagellar basal body P-ring protein FlgI [Gammaproteobacteria bacterium]|nr:MAG: flagellar basal body P-ring protein FlgI [Gammaproteobacteria bacterium]